MPRPKCFPSSSIGWGVDVSPNFIDRCETVSITWDDAFLHGSLIDDNSFFKVYHQCEPPEVIDCVDHLLKIYDYYDLILGWDDRVLKLPNAKFITESACSWLDRKNSHLQGFVSNAFNEDTGKELAISAAGQKIVSDYRPKDLSEKRFAVSFLTSSKNWAPGHVIRQEIYDRLPNKIGDLEVVKHKSPPRIDDKRTLLEPFQFSIVPENSRHNGYYSEKVVDCFVAKTIPLYWGCLDLEKHFNPEGFIRFDTYDDLLKSLQSLTPEYYASKLKAVNENFERALLYVYQWDWIEIYITEGIENKLRMTHPVIPGQLLSPTVLPEYYRKQIKIDRIEQKGTSPKRIVRG